MQTLVRREILASGISLANQIKEIGSFLNTLLHLRGFATTGLAPGYSETYWEAINLFYYTSLQS